MIHFNISIHRIPRFLCWSPGILESMSVFLKLGETAAQ